MNQKKQSNAGFIGMAVVLITVSILLLGLSVARQATEQTEISSQEETASSVYSSAETGLEQALSTIRQAELGPQEQEIPHGMQSSEFYDVNLQTEINEKNEIEINLPQTYTLKVPLESPVGLDDIEVNWSKVDCANNPAALLISIYRRQGSGASEAIYVRHYAIDGCGRNYFETVDAGDNPYQFKFSFNTVGGPNSDLFARIKAIYNDTEIKITGLSNHVTAQYEVMSQAQSREAGQETQAIVANSSIFAEPSFMDFVLVSGNTIVK